MPKIRNEEKKFTFVDSKLQDIFIRELFYLCYHIEKTADSLFSEYQVRSDEVFFSSKMEGLDLVYSLLSSAAKVQELIISYDKTTLHLDRANHIKSILKGLNLNEVYNKKVRNTVEHFSEYLDEANRKHTLFNSSQRYFVAFNMIISHWEPFNLAGFPFKLYKTHQLDLPLYPVRIYIASEKRFYNMDWSINLDSLRNEAHLIKEYLSSQKLFKEKSPEDWVSGLIVC